jgi:hypothetical protein
MLIQQHGLCGTPCCAVSGNAEAYRHAVDLSPGDFRAWYGLGQASAEASHRAEGIVCRKRQSLEHCLPTSLASTAVQSASVVISMPVSSCLCAASNKQMPHTIGCRPMSCCACPSTLCTTTAVPHPCARQMHACGVHWASATRLTR